MIKSFEIENFSGTLAIASGCLISPEFIKNTQKLNLCIYFDNFYKDLNKLFSIAKNLPNKYIYILSEKDINFIENNSHDPAYYYVVQWLTKQYISGSVQFSNNARYTFTAGGIDPMFKVWDQIKTNLRLAFKPDDTQNLDWSRIYDGRFGYNVSAGEIMNYNQHSCVVGQGQPIILNITDRGIDYLE